MFPTDVMSCAAEVSHGVELASRGGDACVRDIVFVNVERLAHLSP